MYFLTGLIELFFTILVFSSRSVHMDQETSSKSEFMDSCSSPMLVFVHGKSNCSAKKKSQAFYSLSKKRVYVKNIRELRNAYRCWPIPQGGLLINPDSKNWFLFNPATMKRIELPQLTWSFSEHYCFLLSSPNLTDQKCIVLLADLERNHLFFYRLGDNKWIKYKYDLGEDKLDYMVACKGKFYGRTRQSRHLMSVELDPRPMLNIFAPEHYYQLPVGHCYFYSFLLESCDEIFYVKAATFPSTLKIVQVSVYKFSFCKKEWDSVESIGGDRIFLLGSNLSASWSASELGVKGDCIYFLKSEDKRLYVFDMEEGTMSTQFPCPDVPSPWFTPFWIMPTTF